MEPILNARKQFVFQTIVWFNLEKIIKLDRYGHFAHSWRRCLCLSRLISQNHFKYKSPMFQTYSFSFLEFTVKETRSSRRSANKCYPYSFAKVLVAFYPQSDSLTA